MQSTSERHLSAAVSGLGQLGLGVHKIGPWRGTIGNTVGPDGSRLDVKGTIPDLDRVVWRDRKVVIAYDADAVMKAPVRIARSELAAHLRAAPWSDSSNGTWPKARVSTTTSRWLARTESWTKSPMSISRVRRGERTCYEGNRL